MKLLTAVIKLRNNTTPATIPTDLTLADRAQPNGILFKEQVLAVTLLTNGDVCFTTKSCLYFHSKPKETKAVIGWRRGKL